VVMAARRTLGRLALAQFLSRAGSHNSLSFGGSWQSNIVTAALSYIWRFLIDPFYGARIASLK
jgi:hypothetical protein